ncbi:GNAT family N-acetyltransferase [Micromonospora cathayae]|uniref:GNAT family N-acetyltransferase n=1 Tax=Micromonospora cathayae TaxID=3028804 RepID=A0ABY7ZRD1_9ACTN|nr:GNAT family N-acetyltransferase [Micromonospora sp. HUAS 3]WDZ85594.1 GNAT family N-acetyltransferase [Micromonospora sp. HUAS 3]
MSLVIAPLDPSDPAAIDAALQVTEPARMVDVPDFAPRTHVQFAALLRHPMPGREQRSALATLDGVPVGYLELRMSHLENPDNAGVELVVHPAYRRRGFGRALLEYAIRTLRELGRKRLIGPTVGPLPGGVYRPDHGRGFAATVGAKPALPEVRRRLEIANLDHAALDALVADACNRAAGYRTVCWQETTPEEYLDDVAYLDSRLILDAPLGDLTMEPDRVDAERIRGTERVLAARGRRAYHHGVLHEATGRVVAWTMLDLHPTELPWQSFQQITIVDPEHRGHRLGLLCKIENLRYALAHEPQLRVIDTWNAASNSYMIAVNEQMGFRAVDAWMEWQLDF